MKDQTQARAEKWKKLDDKKRQAFINHHHQLQQAYRTELLEFVSNMDKKMRLVYLGFNRKRHYQYFKDDIFQDLYPNEKYPVYIDNKSPSPKRETIFHDGGNISSMDMNSDDNSDDSGEGDDDVEPHLYNTRKANGVVSKSAKLMTPDPTEKRKQTSSKLLASRKAKKEEESSSDESDEEHPTTIGRGVQQHQPYSSTDSDDSESEGDNFLGNSIMPVYRAAKTATPVSSQKVK